MRHVQGLGMLPLMLLLPGCFSCYGTVVAEDFDTELSAWREEAADPEFFCNVRIVGECDGGRLLLLHQVDLDTSLTRFYDADTGRFLGSADRGAMCGWTSPLIALQCSDGVIIEVLCGAYEVGDTFSRYAEGSMRLTGG